MSESAAVEPPPLRADRPGPTPEEVLLQSIDRRLKTINGSLNVIGLLVIVVLLVRSCSF